MVKPPTRLCFKLVRALKLVRKMIQLRYLAQSLKMTSPTDLPANLSAQSVDNYNQGINSVVAAMDSSYTSSSHFNQDNQTANFNGSNIENVNIQPPYYPTQCFHINNGRTNIVHQYQYPYQAANSYPQNSSANCYAGDCGIAYPSTNLDPSLTTSLNTPTIENRASPNSSYFSPAPFNSNFQIQPPANPTASQPQQQLGYLSSEYYLNNYHSATAAAAAAAAVAAASVTNQESNNQETLNSAEPFSSSYYFSNQTSHRLYQDDGTEAAQAFAIAANRTQAKGENEASAQRAPPSALVASSASGRAQSVLVAAESKEVGSEGVAAVSTSTAVTAAAGCQQQGQAHFVAYSNATCCVGQSARAAPTIDSLGPNQSMGGCILGSTDNFAESLPACEAPQQQQLHEQQQQLLGRHSGRATASTASLLGGNHFELNYVSPAQPAANYQARAAHEGLKLSATGIEGVSGSVTSTGRPSEIAMSKQSQTLLPQHNYSQHHHQYQHQHQQRQHLQAPRETQATRLKPTTTPYHLINNQQQYPSNSVNNNYTTNQIQASRSSQMVFGELVQRRSATNGRNSKGYKQTTAATTTTAGSQQVIARRKNATRETTAALNEWLDEHGQNPYPTKGEKIMLALLTKMTLIQVSTWFANARRRMKKENKIFWGNKQQAAAAAAAAAVAVAGPHNNNNISQHRIGAALSGSTNNSVFGQPSAVRYLLQKHHRHLKGQNSMLATRAGSGPVPVKSESSSYHQSRRHNGNVMSIRRKQVSRRDSTIRLKSISLVPKKENAVGKGDRIEVALPEGKAQNGNEEAIRSEPRLAEIEEDPTSPITTSTTTTATSTVTSTSSEASSPDSSSWSSSSANVKSSSLAMAILSPSSATEKSSSGDHDGGTASSTQKEEAEQDNNNGSIDKKDS